MKMVEIKYAGAVKELEKLYARLERAEKTLEKKAAIAEKYGVINWIAEDLRNGDEISRGVLSSREYIERLYALMVGISILKEKAGGLPYEN